MLINKNGQITLSDDMMVFDDPRRTVWWSGLIFIKGVAEGKTSLQRFLEMVDKSGLTAACDLLSGNFTCVVFDKTAKCYHAFTDNNRVSNLYYSADYISTSFLQLVKTIKPNAADLQPDSVCAFIITGQVYSKNALFGSISFLNAEDILVVSKNNITIEKKKLRPIHDIHLTRDELYQNLREIIVSLQGKKVSLDMSGGSDTRTLAGVLKQLGLDFELSTDCPPGFPDHDISVKAAAILQKPHFITWHIVEGVPVRKELDETFLRFDGLSDILSFHPSFQNYAKRESRRVEVIISGFAGEMYKDGGWWRVAMQTLFTGRWKEAMIKKLVYSGLVAWGYDPNLPVYLFAGRCETVCRNFSDSLYDYLMNNYNGRNRAELGDRIFNEYSIRTPRSLAQKGMTYYPILLDLNILPFGLHLSFCKRLFAKEYRNLLFKADKKLARLETTKAHTSLSPEWSCMAVDMLKFVANAFKTSVLKKKKVYPVNPLYAVVRKQPETQRYFAALIKAGVLRQTLTLDELPDRYLGRVYTIGKLLEYITS
jgi:hypothetical protein